MLDAALLLAVIFTLVVTMNAIPAFMPSTWMVLAFAYTQADLPLVPLTVGGALSSGVGRVVLSRLTKRFGDPSRVGSPADLARVKRLLDRRPLAVAAVAWLYAMVVPLPNSQVFAAAGLLGARLTPIFVGFCGGRMLADTFWVWTSSRVVGEIDDLMGSAFRTPWGIAVQLTGLLLVIGVLRLPWARWVAGRFLRSEMQ